jgi:ethanolamine ammonia-lyase small subunit
MQGQIMPPTAPSSEDSTAPDATRQLDTLAALPMQQAAWLRAQTPARVGQRRTGISLATSEVLDFQLAHGRARDAVHAPLQPNSLIAALRSITAQEILLLHSAAPDRASYLQRPDLGRKLDDPSRQRLQTFAESHNHSFDLGPDLAIVIADGLSALAVERNAAPLLAELLPTLSGLSLAPISVVEQARVAIGDEIAHAFSAALVIVLIGERPGLSSPDSLGAYITWNPQPGRTTDAERNCISNIRTEGLSYPEAASRLLFYIHEARSKQLTGVALKDPEKLPETNRLSPGPNA